MTVNHQKTMEFLKTKLGITLTIIVFILLGSSYWVLNSGDNALNDNEPTINQPEEILGPTNESDEADEEEAEVSAGTSAPKKESNPVSVDSKPVVFTGFGHSSENRLGLNQNTSTSCTTDANVECVIRFVNADTSAEVTFDPMETDSQGIALWSWSGVDVGSGTWNVFADAGSLTSDAETIYIQ